MPIQIVNVQELIDCEQRGHGELVVDCDGLVFCRSCEVIVGRVGPDEWGFLHRRGRRD